MIVFKSRAFKKLYRMGECKGMIHKNKVRRLAIYLCALLPMMVAEKDREKFFDQLPKLKDSEWAEILEHMREFYSYQRTSSFVDRKHFNGRLDWINGLDTIREFG